MQLNNTTAQIHNFSVHVASTDCKGWIQKGQAAYMYTHTQSMHTQMLHIAYQLCAWLWESQDKMYSTGETQIKDKIRGVQVRWDRVDKTYSSLETQINRPIGRTHMNKTTDVPMYITTAILSERGSESVVVAHVWFVAMKNIIWCSLHQYS